MTTIRWILLTLSVFLSGCGMLGNFVPAHPNTEPAHTPIPVGTEPPSVYILHGQETSPMNKGSFCWRTTDENSICANVAAFPPYYTEDMYTLVSGNTIELLFEAPFPDTMTATLYPESNLTTSNSDIMVDATLDENGKVLVTIPDDVNGNYALVISAIWAEEDIPHGDALYATPVRFEP